MYTNDSFPAVPTLHTVVFFLEDAGQKANSVDPALTDLGLHCLLLISWTFYIAVSHVKFHPIRGNQGV